MTKENIFNKILSLVIKFNLKRINEDWYTLTETGPSTLYTLTNIPLRFGKLILLISCSFIFPLLNENGGIL